MERRGTLAVAAALLLWGCSGVGTLVTEEQAHSFAVGKSTYAAVVSSLGQPTRIDKAADGGRVAVYSYVVKGEMVDAYDRSWTETRFTFDSRDVLTDASTQVYSTGNAAIERTR